MKTFLAGITLLLVVIDASSATTLTVTTHDDGGPGSLRDAIATAELGDTIVFDLPNPDTITLTTGNLLIDKSLTITGPGADMLTVARSSANGTPAFNIFDILEGSEDLEDAPSLSSPRLPRVGENRRKNSEAYLLIFPFTVTKNASPGFAVSAKATISGKHLTNFHACTQNGSSIHLSLRKNVVWPAAFHACISWGFLRICRSPEIITQFFSRLKAPIHVSSGVFAAKRSLR